jgi:RNA polymerase sigma factor (sigma-70 family)
LEELGLASTALFAWLPPDAALDRRDAAARIREALKRLPRRHRAILHARYVEDRSVTEVADTLGISNNYATVLLHRARASFREHAVALRAPPGDP